jgi:hypothetical protein
MGSGGIVPQFLISARDEGEVTFTLRPLYALERPTNCNIILFMKQVDVLWVDNVAEQNHRVFSMVSDLAISIGYLRAAFVV